MKTAFNSLKRHSGHWVVVVMDLPVRSKCDRADGRAFKSLLKGMGFKQLQPSLYARFSFTETSAEAIRAGVLRKMPQKGNSPFFVLQISNSRVESGLTDTSFVKCPRPSRSFALSNQSPSRRIIGVMASPRPAVHFLRSGHCRRLIQREEGERETKTARAKIPCQRRNRNILPVLYAVDARPRNVHPPSNLGL